MKCPNCGMQMKKDFCFHCGYMTNGVIIDTKKPIEATLLELYLGKRYDKITRNENWFISGLLGPIYILGHGHYLVGTLLLIIDFVISLFFLVINHAFLFYLIVILFSGIYLLVNRLLWATLGNSIYITLLSKRLVKYKEKHPDNYKEKIQDLYKKDNSLLILKCLIFELCSCILFIYLKAEIYFYLQFM